MSKSVPATFRQFADSTVTTGDAGCIDLPVQIPDIPQLIQEEEAGQNRALAFNQVEGYQGRLIANLFGSAKRIFNSVGVDNATEFFREIDNAIAQPKKLNITAEEHSGFERYSDPELLSGRLPPIVHSKEDSAPYITSGVVVSRHPVSGRHHLCFIRLAIVDDNTVLFNAATPRIKEISKLTIDAGIPLDVLILIGAPPKVLLSGALHFPDAVDELEVVQKWAGDDLGFVQHCLPIPRTTEMVLVGRVVPEFQQEGPFGDSFGTYSTRKNPICKISEVWTQKDPLYHMLLGGVSNEHVELLVLKAKHELEHQIARGDGVVDYALPLFAGGRLCIVQTRPGFDVQSRLNDLFHIPLVRTIVLVDADIDISSEKDILWAITRRTKGEASFNFCADGGGSAGVNKLVIDARATDLADWNDCRIAPRTGTADQNG